MKKSPNLIKPGDCFRIGEHVIACGDSRNKELVSKLLNKRKVKAVIADPPFGIAVVESARGFKKLANSTPIIGDHLQSDAEYTAFTKDWIEAVTQHLERKNTFHIFGADKMIFALRDGMASAGVKFGQLLVWVKTSSIVGRMDYSPQHELIAYGWYGTHEFLKSKDKSVIVHPKPNRSPRHPTTKPLGLIRRLVLNTTRVGDTVFDGFLGSGTALHACQQTKRICVGIELSPDYVASIIADCERLYGIKAQKI
jgi:DNA modification methylase